MVQEKGLMQRRIQILVPIWLSCISRAGEVSNLRVGKSSGNPDSDAAAMDAVRRASPFRTLPAGYKGRNIDIQFTFDINVFGGDVTN
jgi:TonB family protein